MRNVIVEIWKGKAPGLRALFYVPLFLLSLMYRICLDIREHLYRLGLARVRSAPIPVISVGNITLGGTGKTPVVERLSSLLKERGFRPGIVTRGYRRKKGGVFSVDGRKDTAEHVGDEALMLSRRTQVPVIVGTERIKAIQKGVRDFRIDVAVLDDGFQVRDTRKDIELLVLSGEDERRGEELFPLGPYREPLVKMRKADILLMNKGEPGKRVRALAEGKPLFRVKYRPVHLYNVKRNLITHYGFVRGKKVLAFSGLGDNGSFFRLLGNLGAELVHTLEFPDHHRYTRGDVARIASFTDVEIAVTTEKDAVKMEAMELPDYLFYLSIEAAIEREEELIDLVEKKLRGIPWQ